MFWNKKKKFIPKFTGEISGTALRTILYQACHTNAIYLTDNMYKLAGKDELKRFLFKDTTDSLTYYGEGKGGGRDCDEFSFILMGNFQQEGWSELAFGICFSGMGVNFHQCNIFVCDELKVWFVEPQTDEIILVEKAIQERRKMYTGPRLIMM